MTNIMIKGVNPYELGERKLFGTDKGSSFVDKFGNTWTNIDTNGFDYIKLQPTGGTAVTQSQQMLKHNHLWGYSCRYEGIGTEGSGSNAIVAISGHFEDATEGNIMSAPSYHADGDSNKNIYTGNPKNAIDGSSVVYGTTSEVNATYMYMYELTTLAE